MPIDARIQLKRDTTANWNAATGFIPMAGEIIIYTDYRKETTVENGQTVTKDVAGIKIGDGRAYVQDLPFQSGVTENDIRFWNDKVNINDSYESLTGDLEDETLIFSRSYVTPRN